MLGAIRIVVCVAITLGPVVSIAQQAPLWRPAGTATAAAHSSANPLAVTYSWYYAQASGPSGDAITSVMACSATRSSTAPPPIKCDTARFRGLWVTVGMNAQGYADVGIWSTMWLHQVSRVADSNALIDEVMVCVSEPGSRGRTSLTCGSRVTAPTP